MGWMVLYIAFGVVALWLLGEVLLQYKARLRWRLVAFSGFLCVVVGVLLPSVLVIAGGTVAFAIGQTFVTLSFRRGFSTGWALGGKPGTSRRRRERQGGEMQPLEPLPEEARDPVPPAGYDAPDGPDAPGGHEGPDAPEGAEGYPQDGEYGEQRYDDQFETMYEAPAGGEGGGYAEEIHPGQPPQYQPAAPAYGGPYQDPYADAYAAADSGGYPVAQPQQPAEPYEPAPAFAAYPGPYGGGPGPEAPGEPHDSYDGHAAQPFPPGQDPGQQQPYAASYAGDYAAGAGYAAEPAPGGPWPATEPYYPETPPGGVWVPPQREPDPAAAEQAGYGYPQPEHPDPEGYGGPGQGYYFGQGQRY